MQTLLPIIWLTDICSGFLEKPAFCAMEFTRETMPGARFYDGKKLNIPVSTEAGLDLYERWIHQGLSGIMSAVARKRAKDLNEYHRNKLYKCSKNAENVVEQARCVIQAIDAKMPQPPSNSNGPSRLNVLRSLLENQEQTPISMTVTTDVIQRIEFRTKRNVVNRYNYRLLWEYETKTPFGILGKYLSRTIKMIKNKDQQQQSLAQLVFFHWSAMIAKMENIQTVIAEKQQIGEALKTRLKFSKPRNER
ncbi:unnamed protein product, partial [Gongylonema pulchrum]|uniref:Uncharacterized protein n=1 Tax=Gongylonema pulchrum TaxID=637853 RepID=A0A183DZL9_9BILA